MEQIVLKNIALHHFGGIRENPFFSTQHITIAQLNEAHRKNWPDFKSTLDSYVGYNFVILPSGEMVQTRALGEETAAQRGFNKNTISICLAGNFNFQYDKGIGSPKPGPVDKPTTNQVRAMTVLMANLLDENYPDMKIIPKTRFDLSLITIYPHRFFTNTTCYGTSLHKNWGRQLAVDFFFKQRKLLKKLLAVCMKLIDLLQRKRFKKIALGAVSERECAGYLDIVIKK